MNPWVRRIVRWFMIVVTVEMLAVAVVAFLVAWVCLQIVNLMARAPERIFRPNLRLATTADGKPDPDADLADLHDVNPLDLDWLRDTIRSYRRALR